MKIVVITGSPHKTGTSFLLTDEFIAGAKTNGHDITRFDVGQGDVHPWRIHPLRTQPNISLLKAPIGKPVLFCYQLMG